MAAIGCNWLKAPVLTQQIAMIQADAHSRFNVHPRHLRHQCESRFFTLLQLSRFSTPLHHTSPNYFCIDRYIYIYIIHTHTHIYIYVCMYMYMLPHPLAPFPSHHLPLRSSALRHAAMAAAAVPGRALEPLGAAQRRGEAGRLRRQRALQRRGLHLRRNVAARGSWSWCLGISMGVWDLWIS